MAELICPSCGAIGSGESPLCPTCIQPFVAVSDDIDLADPVAPTSRDGTAGGYASGAAGGGTSGHLDPAGAQLACDDPDCAHGGHIPPRACAHCGRAELGVVVLRFPWGEQRLRPPRDLAIGRENSPLATPLADYPNISRRHAELSLTATGLTVTDLNSVNGTFVNNARIPALRPYPLDDGDEVRFAASLRVTVHLRERDGPPP